MSSGTKLAVLGVATFLLMASLTGATTVALLSDGATVTTSIAVAGNLGAGNTQAGGGAAGNMSPGGAGNTQSTSGSVPLNDRVSVSANATEPDIYRPPST